MQKCKSLKPCCSQVLLGSNGTKQQWKSTKQGHVTYHIQSDRDVCVSDNRQRDIGLHEALIMTAIVYPKELVDLIKMLLQLSEHIHDQVLLPHSQRSDVWPMDLHAMPMSM